MGRRQNAQQSACSPVTTLGLLGELDLRVLGALAPEEHGAAEELGELALHHGGEALGHVVAVVGALGADAHLDELVLVERGVDGGADALGEAVFADLDDGLEAVAEAAEITTLFTGERHVTSFYFEERGERPLYTSGD
jgi:hypothetical protein